MSAFEEYVYEKIVAALERIPESERSDIYVVSLLVYDEDDDPRRPTITVGFNTEQNVRDTTSSASDAGEARWNFAFWLQNELAIVAHSNEDPEGARLRRAWIDELGAWYSDDELDADYWAVNDRIGKIIGSFIELAVRVVQRLHGEGVVEGIFGGPVPVLIHELEYYDQIADQNERANPGTIASEFTRWIRTVEGV